MRMYVAGEWLSKPQTIPVENPFDRSVVDTVPRADRGDVERALQSAVRGARAMAKLSGYDRFKILKKAAELMVMEAGWKYDQGTVTDQDMAMAKLKATEMLAFVADEAIQIHGGMGLMDDLPLERIWRDARVERIWEGTSEIQRHIISRALLRAVGG